MSSGTGEHFRLISIPEEECCLKLCGVWLYLNHRNDEVGISIGKIRRNGHDKVIITVVTKNGWWLVK